MESYRLISKFKPKYKLMLTNSRQSGITKSNTKISLIAPTTPTYYKVATNKQNKPKINNTNSTNRTSEVAIPLKIVVVGDGASGKTSFLRFYTTGVYITDYTPTVFESTQLILSLDDSLYQLELWDTAGQDDYARLRPLAYNASNAFILCFSLDNADSFNNVTSKWIPELKHYGSRYSPILLVGLKSDLRESSDQCIPFELPNSLYLNGIVEGYIEASSITGEGIELVIEAAVRLHRKGELKSKKKDCNLM